MNENHNPHLTPYSQKLRKTMTREECHLWYDFLKGLPVNIHRQKVIGQYIVDFYCASARLIIEIDGSQHTTPDGIAADAVRDAYLKGLGLIVKRYTNTDINQDFESVCRDIYHFLFPDEKLAPYLSLCATFPSRGRLS